MLRRRLRRAAHRLPGPCRATGATDPPLRVVARWTVERAQIVASALGIVLIAAACQTSGSASPSLVRSSPSVVPTPAATSAPMVTPMASLVAGPLTWQAVGGDPYARAMWAVLPFEGGFVALGEQEERMAEWRSTDGTTWRSVDPTGDPVQGKAPRQMVAGGPGLVVIDWMAVDAAVPHGLGYVMTSDDGERWTRARTAAFEANEVPDLVTNGRLLLAYGSQTVGGRLRSMTWTSQDGLVWSENPIDLPAPFTIVGVDGGFVAFPGTSDLRTWTSVDGRSWAEAAAPPASSRSSMNALSAAPGGLAAATFGGDPDTLLTWRSVDRARSWSAFTAPTLGTSSDPADVLLAETPAGLFLLGSAGADGPRAWRSVDGMSWIEETGLSDIGDTRLELVAQAGSRIVVFGRSAESFDWSAWVAQAPS